MKKFRYIALMLSALTLCSALTACSDEKKETPAEVIDGVGELITPDPDSDEADLGSYRISENGVKLYYDENEYPTELVLTLEKYFRSFADGDYEAYTSTVFPDYIEEMEVFLERDYNYDLETSFNSQCENLELNVGSKFTVTRIKLEPPEAAMDEEECFEYYFESLDDAFEKDYYSEVRELSDDLYYAVFYVMAEDSLGEETLLVSGFEIVFAEMDGQFYVFG